MGEGREITADVEGEAVHRNPMAHANADRCDFAFADPNAGESLALCRGNFVISEKFDEQSLEPAQIAMQILAAPAQIGNCVSHQLSRAVVSRLAAAVDSKKGIGQMRRVQ